MKTNKKFLFAFALIGFGYLHLLPHKASAQQSNIVLPDFNKVNIGQTFEAELVAADRNSIYIDLPDDKAKEVDAHVSGTTLVLKHELKNERVKVKIYFKTLNYIEASGASKVYNNDTIDFESLSMDMNGASNMKLNLRCENLKLSANGASDITLNGAAKVVTMEATGAVNIKASGLRSVKLSIELTGAATAKVNVSETLNAKVSGIGKVIYSGEPVYRNIAVSGVGSVKDAKDGEEYGTDNAINDMINGGNGDTTRFKIGKRRLMIIEDKNKKEDSQKEEAYTTRRRMKRVYAGFELGVNSFVTPAMKFSFDNNYKFLDTKLGNSWFFGLNLFEADGQLIRNKLALTSGLGMQFSNYNFDGNTYLTPNIDTLKGTASAPGVSLTTNKLYTFDWNVPLLLKFAPGSQKRAKAGFHIAAGVILHYVVSSKVVTETSSNGYVQHNEYHDDFNINAFRADATVRAGYNKVKLFANYALTPYFNTNYAPDIRVFAAGITLVGF